MQNRMPAGAVHSMNFIQWTSWSTVQVVNPKVCAHCCALFWHCQAESFHRLQTTFDGHVERPNAENGRKMKGAFFIYTFNESNSASAGPTTVCCVLALCSCVVFSRCLTTRLDVLVVAEPYLQLSKPAFRIMNAYALLIMDLVFDSTAFQRVTTCNLQARIYTPTSHTVRYLCGHFASGSL